MANIKGSSFLSQLFSSRNCDISSAVRTGYLGETGKTGADGATAPETLRQKDQTSVGHLESGDAVSMRHPPKEKARPAEAGNAAVTWMANIRPALMGQTLRSRDRWGFVPLMNGETETMCC